MLKQVQASMEPPAHIPGDGAPEERIAVLDGVRGLAILLVMLYHNSIIAEAGNWVDRAFAHAVHLGWIGVDLFFVLSGFLITGILLQAKSRRHYFRNFYARRLLRIFPLYYAVVFFCLVILPGIPNPKSEKFASIAGDELWYWLHLSNFSIARAAEWRHPILDVSWSLAIEEQFYLVWPMVVLLLRPRAIVRVCGFLLLAALATRVGMALADQPPIRLFVLTPARMDGLAIGSLIACLARQESPDGQMAGLLRYRPLAKVMLAVLALVIVALSLVPGEGYGGGGWVQCAGYTVVALAAGSLLVVVSTAGAGTLGQRLFGARWLVLFGKYSYAMYLFHLPLRAVLRDAVFHNRLPVVFGSILPGQLLFYAGSMAMTLAAAWVSWHAYEKHFLKLKKWFPSGTAA